jgi:hypothetical protein
MELIEILTFQPADGADETALLDTDRRVQVDFAYQQPGIVRRTTARNDDGDWAVITVWGSPEEADAAARRARDDPATNALAALIDAASVRTQRFLTLE